MAKTKTKAELEEELEDLDKRHRKNLDERVRFEQATLDAREQIKLRDDFIQAVQDTLENDAFTTEEKLAVLSWSLLEYRTQ